MLYDPKWERKSNTDELYSLPGLIAWLETQPPEQPYNWWCLSGSCLIGLYYAAHGVHDRSKEEYRKYHEVFRDEREYGRVCGVQPWTFGAALIRAREALATR